MHPVIFNLRENMTFLFHDNQQSCQVLKFIQAELLFNGLSAEGMLQGKDCCTVDTVQPFVDAFMDRVTR